MKKLLPSEARHRKEMKQLTESRDQWASLERMAVKALHASQAEVAEWKARFDKLLLRDGLCDWAVDEDGVWGTGCGGSFQFEDGGPRQNGFDCCPYCGRLLRAAVTVQKGSRPMTLTKGSPMCPWCGDEVDDTPDEIKFTKHVARVDCGSCARPVIITRCLDITYDTVKDERQS